MLENLSNNLQQEHPELLSNIRRHLNLLKENQIGIRKKAISQLLTIVKTQQLSANQFEDLTQLCLKDCLKCLSDTAEHCRQTSVDIIIELLPRCKYISAFLPYIFSILIDRTNCYDLEGLADLPQKMRPAPGQKPKVMIKLIQNCEQIRLKFCHLLRKIIGLAEESDVRKHLDDMINIMRALVMDPSGQIQKYSCQIIEIFCKEYKLLLLHYTEILGRAVLLPLISKKSKIRIAALNALTSIFWCGLWKYNAFVFENLIGFRDPNSVPIKDFYQPSHNINYLATFIIDQNPRVRLEFLKHLYIWVCKLDDKYDHHGKLVPYVLSGLFDSDDQIRKIALDTIVEIGSQIEVQREKDFRENKQFAIDAAWTWDGKMIDLPLIEPLQKRPSIGSRFFIRGHVRKMWGALYHEINDINYQNRKRAVNLLIFGVIYTENYLTQFLDVFIPKTLSSIITTQNEDQFVANKISLCYHYIGRYCEQSSYLHIMKSILAGELVQNEHFIRCGLKALAYLIKGNLQDIPTSQQGLCRKRKQMDQLLTMITNIGLANEIFHANCLQAKQLCKYLITGLNQKSNKEDISQIFSVHFSSITKLIAVSYYQQNFSIFSAIKVQKQQKQKKNNNINQFLTPLLQNIYKVWPQYVDELKQYIGEIFFSISSSTECLGLQDSNWKFILVLHNYFCFNSFNTQDTSQQQVLFALIQDVIKENLKYNFSIEMVNFLIKYLSHIIHYSSQSKFKSRIILSSEILGITLEKIQKFNLIKKVPIYDQHLVNTEPQKGPSMQQDTFYLIYINCSHAIQAYYMQKLQISPQQLANILYYFTKTFVTVRRSNQCTMQAIKTLWVTFQRNQLLNLQFPSQFTIGQQKQAAFPKIIDFMIERFETLGEAPDPKRVNMIFSVLTNMLKCWPSMPLATDKIPYIYPEYPQLLDNLFKYALNEKDLETKSKFCNFLQKLCKKMTGWFKHEAKISNESKRFQKSRFIEEIIKNANV